MEFVEVREGLARILIPKANRIYDAPVFYNPVMRFNRDISTLAVRILGVKSVVDALSATGVRGIRYALETQVEEVWLNDINEDAFRLIVENVKRNIEIEPELTGRVAKFQGAKRITVTNDDANRVMANNFRHFEFVDLDPFGSPMEFLDTALRSVRRRGVLAITATDTGVLCGAYKHACRRKYLAEPIRRELCHEAGLRILIGAVVKYAAKYDLGVDVLLAYYRDHYFRAFLRLKSGAKKADDTLKRLGYVWQEKNGRFEYNDDFLPRRPGAHGPLWLGPLKNQAFVETLLSAVESVPLGDPRKTPKFLRTLAEELDVPFHYDTHALARRNNFQVGKLTGVIKELRDRGHRATRTHFSPTALKTDAPFEDVLDALRDLR
ncbi:tRNA (guanine(10)-N(2))-dimethyltransferase [Thermococcus sp.]|uniref:tRNA (guanine(10)-N(2))-dimethyltransferase n=1 Tax=Thermococcus sp. TaxID=35749 RepID=UPI0026113463|nr:tRNA (guanine(10)-N(2))-dimethyltransferase [Thermococcus sp.]